jgi:chromate transporter
MKDISFDLTIGTVLPYANFLVIIGTFFLLTFTKLRPQFIPLFCFVIGVVVNYYHL